MDARRRCAHPRHRLQPLSSGHATHHTEAFIYNVCMSFLFALWAFCRYGVHTIRHTRSSHNPSHAHQLKNRIQDGYAHSRHAISTRDVELHIFLAVQKSVLITAVLYTAVFCTASHLRGSSQFRAILKFPALPRHHFFPSRRLTNPSRSQHVCIALVINKATYTYEYP